MKWRYFAGLAKIIHCWRDNARALYVTWSEKFGPVAAETFAAKLPSKCIAGRWCSIFETEEDLGQLAGVIIVFALQGFYYIHGGKYDFDDTMILDTNNMIYSIFQFNSLFLT